MKIVFATSSPTGPLDGSYVCKGLDIKNQFVENLKEVVKENCRALIITASPYEYQQNDQMCDYFREQFIASGFHFETFDLCDDRYVFSKQEIETYDLIILGGGHVPTQNRFFKQIHLRECLEDYDGILLGISAGSMNLANHVYVEPEEPGETSEFFCRDLTGLGVTRINLIPHYQMVKNNVLDGKRLFEDVVNWDSYGREIYLIEDGTYISNVDGCFKMYGKAYLLKDGITTLFCRENEVRNME